MITNPYSGKQIPGTGVLDLSIERKTIKEDQSQSPPTPTAAVVSVSAVTSPQLTKTTTTSATVTTSTATATNNNRNSTTATSSIATSHGKQAGKSIQWTNDLTHIFLRFMPEAHKKLTNDKEKPIKGKVWSELFDKFKETIIDEKVGDERFLDMVASEHLQNKWKDLKKRYAIISNTGKTSVDWPFYEQLEHILKDNNSNVNNNSNNNDLCYNNNNTLKNNANNNDNNINITTTSSSSNNSNNNNNASSSNNGNSDSHSHSHSHNNSSHDISDNESNNIRSNKNGKAKIGPTTTATLRDAIEAQDSSLCGIKRVASEFMDELKTTLEEDRKLRRLDLENERKKRQADTQLLLGSILDEMQRSSENSFRLMRTLIQSSFGDSPPAPQATTAMYYYNSNSQPPPPPPPPPHQQQSTLSSSSSSPPPQQQPQPYYKHDYHQPHPQFQQYNPQKNHRHFR